MIKVKCVFKNWQMVVVFFVFIFFLNVFSMFVVPSVPVLRADYFWPGVESGGPLCKCLLSPITQLAALPRCSAHHALLGLHHHAHFVEHGFVVCRPILPFASSMQCLKVQRSIFCLSRISRVVLFKTSVWWWWGEDASEALPKVTK